MIGGERGSGERGASGKKRREEEKRASYLTLVEDRPAGIVQPTELGGRAPDHPPAVCHLRRVPQKTKEKRKRKSPLGLSPAARGYRRPPKEAAGIGSRKQRGGRKRKAQPPPSPSGCLQSNSPGTGHCPALMPGGAKGGGAPPAQALLGARGSTSSARRNGLSCTKT